MRTSNSFSLTIVLLIGLVSCKNQGSNPNAETQRIDTATSKSNTMKSYISIFEIPASEISRAINFYQEIFNINIERMDMPQMQMGIFPYTEQMVTGVIIKADGYNPSADGVTIYLNGGDNLQVILDKVENKGGKVLVKKTEHADGSGYFALFLDSEGNKIGLHSPN